MIDVVFFDNDLLFVALFHSSKTINWHFFYSIKHGKIIGKPVSTVLCCSKENFLQSLFYNLKTEEFYAIYRLGQCITTKFDKHLHEINSSMD